MLTEIEKVLRVFCVPGQVVELRALGVQGRKAVCEVFSDLGALARRAAELDAAGAQGVYFTLNPLKPDMVGRKVSARKEDVARRHFIPLDFDPVRPDGVSSTDDELKAAWSVLDASRTTMEAAGFRGAIVGCSGNGWHLCYPTDLPNDDNGQAAVKAVLHALAARHNTEEARIDMKCLDAVRIWKLYGTTARKGPNQVEEAAGPDGEVLPPRPHRLAF